MRSFWSEPYLWVHLAGAATLPILLEICVLALGAGEPFLPVSLEFLLVAIAGITPILWMQWQRPFCIFSLVFLALQPSQLTEHQRRLLSCFKSQEIRLLSGVAALSLVAVLWQLFHLAPLTIDVAPYLPGGRLTSLGIAAIAFLLCNLFLQVPVSVARVLALSETQVASAIPYPAERIAQDFTLVGLRVKQILPEMQAFTPSPVGSPVSTVPPSASAVPWPVAEETNDTAEPWEDDDAEDRQEDEFALSDEVLEETADQLESLTAPPAENTPALDTGLTEAPVEEALEVEADLVPGEATLEPTDGTIPPSADIAVPLDAAESPEAAGTEEPIDLADAESADEAAADDAATDVLAVVESVQDIPTTDEIAAAVNPSVDVDGVNTETHLEEAATDEPGPDLEELDLNQTSDIPPSDDVESEAIASPDLDEPH